MKLFRYIFVTLILLSVIGCYQSLNAGRDFTTSTADTISNVSMAKPVPTRVVTDSDLRPLVKDTIEFLDTKKVLLLVTPIAKSRAKKEIVDHGFFKSYNLEPGDSSYISFSFLFEGVIGNYEYADSIIFDREINKGGNVIRSIGYIKDGQYGRQDNYRGQAITLTAVMITQKYRALADSILDNVEILRQRQHDDSE